MGLGKYMSCFGGGCFGGKLDKKRLENETKQKVIVVPISQTPSHVIVARNSIDDNNLGKFVSSEDLMVIVVSLSGKRVSITSDAIVHNAPEPVKQMVERATEEIIHNQKNTQVFVMHEAAVFFVDGFCLGGDSGVVFVRRCKKLPSCMIEYKNGIGNMWNPFDPTNETNETTSSSSSSPQTT